MPITLVYGSNKHEGGVLDLLQTSTGYNMGQQQLPYKLNPSNAEATSIRSTRTQRFLKTILTLLCWYSLDSTRWKPWWSDQYTCFRVSVIFKVFASFRISQISH